MRRKLLWRRGLRNKQGRATKEATPPLYFGCLTNITNTPFLWSLHSTIWCRQRTWNIYLGWKHKANGLNQDMGLELSTVKFFKQSSHMSKLQYLSSCSIWHSPYSLGFWAPLKTNWKRGKKEQGTGNDQAVEVGLSASTYEGACSALSYLYHDSGKNKDATSPQLWPKLSSYKKF